MNLDLGIPGYALVTCLVGLSTTTLVLAFGRLRFANTHARQARWGNENVPAKANPPLRLVHRYALLSGIQLLLDVSIAGYFAYLVHLRVTFPEPSAFLSAHPPMWPWLIAGAARIILEFPIRATKRAIIAFTMGPSK